MKKKLAASDSLLYQSVYHLYGLAEEKIAVGEGEKGGRLKFG